MKRMLIIDVRTIGLQCSLNFFSVLETVHVNTADIIIIRKGVELRRYALY